jgi:hypothetical protein
MSKLATADPAAFPADFPIDTEYVHAALRDWNSDRRIPLVFGELTSSQMMQVLTRAGWLKQEAEARR